MRTPVQPSCPPSPAAQGYRLPAEWQPHRATWLAWPLNPDDWPGKFEPIPWVYVEIVRHLHRCEQVCIVALPEVEAAARGLLLRAGVDLSRIEFLPFPTDRGWLRDSGAMVLSDGAGRRAGLDWHFNGWAKYDNWQHDEELARRMCDHLGLPSWQPLRHGRRVVLEGGAIDVNGAGLVLTTEECLLSDVQARNPGLAREDVEEVLCDFLGVKKVLWLGRGIAGDDTHGHVDDLARFVGPRTVVTVVEDDAAEDNYEPLRDNLARLRTMTDVQGRALEVVTLPMPAPLHLDGQRLPASYANFYIANKVVLVPTFNDPRDRQALTTLAGLFPGREVLGIHAVDLVWGLGTLHCLTQQEPAGGNATESDLPHRG
jgi:agmatine deiminase